MPQMDRARRIGGLIWVLAGLLFQLLLALWRQLVPGPVTLAALAVMGTLAALTLAPSSVRVRRAATTVAAVFLALDLLGAVADRFGVLGPTGASGVSWGSWSAFTDYTGRLLPGASASLVLLAAVGATAAETVLGLALITGRRRRWVGKAAAGLFAVYCLTMARSLGLESLAEYAVPVLVGGSLLISAAPAPALPAGSHRPGMSQTGRRSRLVQD